MEKTVEIDIKELLGLQQSLYHLMEHARWREKSALQRKDLVLADVVKVDIDLALERLESVTAKYGMGDDPDGEASATVTAD